MASRLLLRTTPSPHLLASLLLRPNPSITSFPHRHLATATLPPPPKSEATLETVAHSPQTTDTERHLGGVVGGEGAHYQAQFADTSSAKEVAAYDLSDPHHGDWVQFHPVYSREQLDSVKVVRRQTESVSDKIASGLVKGLRKGFDIVSLYKHTPLPKNHEKMSLAELRKMGCYMDDHQWLTRILFLETTAAIPGMVAGAVRHLHSLRLMRRDGGWIHTLLEEAENERMHLLTFMTLRNPGWFFRAIVLGAQGVFYNLFFLTYILSPKVAHRFVGFLEEEAVVTYTRVIEEMEAGRLPEWENKPAPDIAISYWRLAPNATLLDTIRAVRADEATHRFVNHSLASLEPSKDFNPFSLAEPPAEVRGTVAGFSREESAAFAREARKKASEGALIQRAEEIKRVERK